jgi:hypothetical protein
MVEYFIYPFSRDPHAGDWNCLEFLNYSRFTQQVMSVISQISLGYPWTSTFIATYELLEKHISGGVKPLVI